MQRVRRVLKAAGRFVAWCVAVSVALVLLYRIVDPRLTPLMAVRWLQGDGLTMHWVRLNDVSPAARRAVIAAEDAHFVTHYGFDAGAIRKALKDHERNPKRRARGASTITMQCARNVFLWPPSRTYVRKALELWFTLLIELLWGKARILEVYLNVAEWGRGIYGIEAASQKYFGVPASALDARRAALLAAALPLPRKRDPGRPSGFLSQRAARIRRDIARVHVGHLGT